MSSDKNLTNNTLGNAQHLDLNDKANGKFRISNKQAQADYTLVKTYKNVNGATVYKKSATTNDEKIADTCVEIFQNSNIESMIDIKNIKKETMEEVDKLFIDKNIIIDENSPIKDVELIKKKKKIAFNQMVKSKIEKSVKLEYSIDYQQFIERTGIKSMHRVGDALKILDGMQNKNFYQWNEERLDENLNIVNNIVKIAVVPEIRLELDHEIGGKTDVFGNKLYNSIADFINAPIKNKSKYIKKITFKLNPSYLSNILGLERDYSEPDRKQRINFKSSYSFRLDTLLRSIEKIQNYQNLTHFTFAELQKKFGTQYKLYKHFKARVLEPAVEDINNYTNLTVQMIETREAGERSELKYVKFVIGRKSNILIENNRYGINSVAYYISSRLFYFKNNGIRNLLAYARKLEEEIKDTLDISIYDTKSLFEWKEEAQKAYQIEIELLNIVEKNKLFISQNRLKYDDKRMCLVSIEYDEEENIKESIKILTYKDKKVTNPMESIDYLKDLLSTGYSERVDIFDYLPFEIANTSSMGWVKINSMIDYQKHENTIIDYMNKKKLDHFRFENQDIADLFYKHVYRGTFRQLDYMIQNTSKLM